MQGMYEIYMKTNYIFLIFSVCNSFEKKGTFPVGYHKKV